MSKICLLGTFFFGILAAISAACTLPSAATSGPTDTGLASPTPNAVSPAPTPLKRDADLEEQIAAIAAQAKGKIGVAAVVLETGQAAMLNSDDDFPMQSVYKLPISLAVMNKFQKEGRSLDEMVSVTKADMVRQGQASPLRDAHPDGGNFTIRELIRLAMVESDGTASDVLMRVAGGPGEVQAYLTQIDIQNIKVVNTEKEMGADWQAQYQNWATPMAAVELLRSLKDKWVPDLGQDEKELLLIKFMKESNTGRKRLKGLLPEGAVVAHKTGTGGTQNGITSATNDIGIIYLPNGNHLAIAVFVSDSAADDDTRDAVIAKIAKAVWDLWNK